VDQRNHLETADIQAANHVIQPRHFDAQRSPGLLDGIFSRTTAYGDAKVSDGHLVLARQGTVSIDHKSASVAKRISRHRRDATAGAYHIPLGTGFRIRRTHRCSHFPVPRNALIEL
jgi:hypothetical protein